MGASAIVLSISTLACWAVFLISLLQVIGRDAHGDAVVGQAVAFLVAASFVGLTWLWLGGLLLQAVVDDVMPGGAAGAIFLHVATGAAAAAAMYLVQDPKQQWPAIIPIVAPLLLVGYVAGLYQPALRLLLTGKHVSLAVQVALVLLSLAPWPAILRTVSESARRRAENKKAQDDWEIKEKQVRRAENLMKLQAMEPDAPVSHWYALLEEDGGVHTEALDRLRHLARRQSDIEDMLSYGIPKAMMLVPDLDLEATPRLCAAAQAYLQKRAHDARLPAKDEASPYTSEGYVLESLAGIRWLQSRGCNCDDGLAAVEAAVQSYLDSPERQNVLASLAELRRKSKPL
jgi:hypothetical protein